MILQRLIIFIAAMMAVAAVAPLQAKLAPANTPHHDFQCLGLLGLAADKLTDHEKDSVTGLAIYFIGSLFGRDPGLDVAAFARDNPDIDKGIDQQADTQSCIEEVGTASKKLEALP